LLNIIVYLHVAGFGIAVADSIAGIIFCAKIKIHVEQDARNGRSDITASRRDLIGACQ